MARLRSGDATDRRVRRYLLTEAGLTPSDVSSMEKADAYALAALHQKRAARQQAAAARR